MKDAQDRRSAWKYGDRWRRERRYLLHGLLAGLLATLLCFALGGSAAIIAIIGSMSAGGGWATARAVLDDKATKSTHNRRWRPGRRS